MNKPEDAIEKILDDNNQENVILYDEDDNPTEFEQVALIPMEDRVFVLLSPVEKTEGVDADDAFVFEIQNIDGEDYVVGIDDEEVTYNVYKEYYAMLKEAGHDVEEFVKDLEQHHKANK